MKSAVPPQALVPCVATQLGRQFRDRRPTVDYYRGVHEITVDSQRGEKLAFVTVESDYAGGSVVSFWNGDLYWPNHITSGVWPDVMRDNWHRFEAAENACEPQPMAAKPVARARPAPRPAPAAKPSASVTKAKPLKPLTATTPAKAPMPLTTTMPAKAPASTSAPQAKTPLAKPAKAPTTTTTQPPTTPPAPATTPLPVPPAASGDPAVLGS
ncbi:MAG TPA: hypothetical protein VGF43_04830 [Dongiaceae bacterium]